MKASASSTSAAVVAHDVTKRTTRVAPWSKKTSQPRPSVMAWASRAGTSKKSWFEKLAAHSSQPWATRPSRRRAACSFALRAHSQ